MQKNVTVSYLVYDEGIVVSNVEAQGTTEDEGVTVVIGNGYVPDLETTDPSLVTVTVHQPAVVFTPATLVSRVNDAEANTSTLVFDLGTGG